MQAMEALLHKGASKHISTIFALLGISSSLWSICFGAIPVQVDPDYAYLLRCFGMIGTFATLIFASVLISEWVGVCKPTKYFVVGFSLFGIVIFPYNVRHEYIEFEQYALIYVRDNYYSILRLVTIKEGIDNDEGVIFMIDDNKNRLILIEDEEIIDEVYDVYFSLLDENNL
jgi:hypothetical protein